MKETTQLRLRQWAAFGFSTLSLAALVACGDKPAPEVKPASATSVAAEVAPLKVAFVYIGPVGDGGWTFSHDQARKNMEQEFGNKIVTSFVENVPESTDAERVFRDMVGEGNQLVFGTSFGYMESLVKVANDHKAVKFEHVTGYKTAENLRTYDSRTYEGAYLAGILAGSMTKSNILGVVGSVPIPEVIRNLNSFTLGAKSVNPNIQTKVVWVNDWFSPPKEGEAATALINAGADILFQNTNSAAVVKTAQEKGKRAFGWNASMRQYGEQAHLGAAIINWTPYYSKAIRETLDGTWQTGQSWWGVKEGAIDLIDIADDVPEQVKVTLEAAKQGLRDGSHVIWKGPIKDNTGREVLAHDVVADDAFLRNINFYVDGIDGKVPGFQ